jgi:hypothetical protein
MEPCDLGIDGACSEETGAGQLEFLRKGLLSLAGLWHHEKELTSWRT